MIRISNAHAIARRIFAVFAIMALQMLVAPAAQAQHTSTECPPQTATVTAGGTVTLDITDCTSLIGFVGTGPVDGGSYPAGGPYNFPDHGAANGYRGGPGNNQWFMTYSHNGTTGIGSTDVFETTDGQGDGDVLITITILPSSSPLSVSPGSLPTLTAGTPFSQTLTTTGGTGPYTYALQSGALPLGVSLSSGGVLSGTPTQRGGYTFSVRATDSTTPTANFVDKGYTGSVQNPTLTLTTNAGTAIQGAPFSQTLSTSGGVAPYVYQLETGTLPSGITISSAGVVSGTTSAAPGNYPVVLRVGDASTPSNAAYFELENYTLTVSPPPSVSIAVSPASVNEDGVTNLVYTVTRSAATTSAQTVNLTYSGTATSGSDYTGAAASVVIPANATTATLTLDPTADTTSEANETAIVSIAAGSGYTIGAPSSATGTINNDEGTSVYCPTLLGTVAWGGSISINAGSCNAGFGLGVVLSPPTHGTATVGTFGANQPIIYTHNGSSGTTDTFTVNDGEAPPNNQIRVNITITPPTSSIVVSPSSLSTITAGSPFSQTITATGGTGPYTFTVTGGTIPPGLTLSTGGVLSGTATQRGAYSFTVRAQDSLGAFSDKGYSGTVAVPTLAITPTSATAVQNVPFSLNIAASGGIAPYSFLHESAAGPLPPGMSLSSTGVLSGTPTTVGTTNFQMRVTDSSTGTGSYFELENFSFTVSAPPTVSIAVSPATVQEDGATNATFTVTRSLNLSSATTVNLTTTGTATAGTDFSGNVATVTIPAGATTATVTIDPAVDSVVEPDETVTLTVAAGTGYTVGAPASATTTIQNDDVINLSINDVTVTEGNAGTTNATFTVNLSAPAGPGGVTFDITTANGSATGGVDYVTRTLAAQTIAAGSSSYTFTVLVNGDLLNETNETFFVNLTNVVGATVTDGQGLGTITNDDALPTISTSDLSVTEGNSGTTNAVVTVTLSAASGQTVSVNYAAANATATQPADYTATSGTLTFAAGETSKTITVPVIGETVPEANETFSVGLFGAVNATITVPTSFVTIINDDVPVTVSPASLPGGTVGVAYSQALSASGGTAPYSFAVTAGALPAGLSIAGGTISGTPTAGGTFNFTVTATDSAGAPGPFSGSQAYTLTIAAPTMTLPATSLAGGTLAAAYSASISPATGGTTPYSYAVTAGALPGGLTLNPSSGAITGTPAALGTFNFSITATDSSTGTGPYTATQAYAITVIDIAPVPAPSSLTVSYNAAATNVPLSLSGGAPTSLAIATAPSNGTAIVSGTTITYQPNAGYAGSDSFTYSATNSGGTSAPATVSVTVQDPVITITPTGGFNATVAAPYTQTFTFNGGAQPWSGYQVTNLPAGLSITGTTANTVTISGSPTQAGAFNLNVSATDSSTGNGPYAVGQAFTLTVAAPGLALSPAPGTLNAPYAQAFSQNFAATGGVGPYTYVLTGALPSGMTFSNGTISGSPVAPGSFPITITATDTGSTGAGAPFSIAQNYTIDVPAPTIAVSPASLPNPVAGASYSQTVTASGGVGPYSFSITAGALPTGLSLAPGGAITGTATEVGNFSFAVTAMDNFGQFGTRNYTLIVAAPTLTMTPAAGVLSAPYAQTFSQAFTAAGGSGSFSYVLSGALPAGLSFSNGTISGIPTVPGAYPVTVTATDTVITGVGAPYTVAQNYTINVPAPVITVGPASLPNPVLGNAYVQNLSATGGAISYNFAITAGSLPSGIFLSGGTIAGTTYQVGTFNFTVTVTDGNGQTGSRAYTLTVAAPTYTMTPAAGLVTAPYGQPFNQAFTAVGGSGTYTYALTGPVPPGLTFSNGTLSGTPTSPGFYAVTITATDQTVTGLGAPFGIAQNYNIYVAPPTIAVTPASLPGAAVGGTYSQTLSATGGVGPYAFAITAGGLPSGLSLSGANLTGTPTQAGTFNLTVTATDANGQTASRAYTLTVGAPALAITPAAGALPITYNAPFSRIFAASGGIGPYSYALTGTLPAGLSFNAATATVSGTPTTSGNFSFTVTATDTGSTGSGAPFSVSNTYTLAIAAPTITVTPAALPGGIAGQAYSVSLTGAGAVAPYSFGLTGGTLPAGVTLSTSGQLAGTPTVSGSFPITVQVRDANAQQTTVNLTLNVAVPTLAVTPASLPGALFGIAYSQQLTTTGGIAPYTYTVSSGALPAGMTLGATGLLSGTPNAAGSFPFAVTVRDSTGGTAATATVNFTLQVQQRPDPALDPQVRGLVQAQGEATRRFATTQINNFQQRLDRLHERGSDDAGEGNRISVTNSLRLSLPDICRDAQVRANSARCVQQRNALSQLSGLGSSYSEAGLPTGGRSNGAGAPTAAVASMGNGTGSGTVGAGNPDTAQPRANAGSSGSGTATGTVGIWTAGIIRFGNEDAAAGRASSEFESEGITIGADYRFSPTFAAGLGVGFGRDRVDIGTQGSFSRGEAKTVALYASLLPANGVFIDGLIGYQWLDFDLRRYVTSTGRLIDSQRSGYQWFGSVSLGADLATGAWQITPYARLDLSRARLNGYTESSGSVFDLTFLDQDVNSTTLGLGTKIRYSHDLGWARLYPELNAEYRWQLENNGDVLLTYADRLSGPYSAIRLTSLDRNELTLGTKLDLELNSGWLFGLHYITRASGGEGSDSTVKVVISHEF